MGSTFVFDSQNSSFVLLQPDMPMASTLDKQCFLCNVKEIDGNCLVDSQESSLILCEVFNVSHLMNDLKKLENIFYCHPCLKRILKVHESLKILKILEKQLLEEKYSIELQLETNYKVVDNEMYSSSCEFGVQLVKEMRFKSIKSKLKKVVKGQIERKFSLKTKYYRIMKNITITEKLNHRKFIKYISKETTPLISNIISIGKQQFIKENLSVPSNGQFVDTPTNLPFLHAELPLTSHVYVYNFEDIKLDLLNGDTNNTADIKDPFEGIDTESGFVTENSISQKTFICEICETDFGDYTQLDEHCRTHHTVEKSLNRSYCEKPFSLLHNAKSHERTHTGEKPFKCSYCAKALTRLRNVKAHERIHTGEKPFKCSYCAKPFSLLQNAKSHERTHTGEKPFKCSYCAKPFTQLRNVKTHERIHTGEKPFKCSYCRKLFSRSDKVKLHERIHTAIKHFNCKFCEKTFSRKCSMEVHERIHTDERPFKCGYCDKAFRGPVYRKSHESTHMSVKPFKCIFCEKGFLRKETMEIHERIHTDERPFKCGYCDKTFRVRANMKKHEAIHTRENFSGLIY